MSALDLFRRTRRPAGLHAADALTERIPRQPAAEVPQDEPHGIAAPETLAALVARAGAQQSPGAMGATPTLPHAVAWRNGVQPRSEVIPFVPLTMEASIYDGMRGDEKTARSCAHCGALSGRGDLSWREDALCRWSCPACQAQPEWHAPSLPGLRITTPEDHAGETEMGIMARSLLAANQRCVRQRPDGLWMAVIPIEGRIKPIGPFEHRADAEEVYATFLGAATEAAEEGAA